MKKLHSVFMFLVHFLLLCTISSLSSASEQLFQNYIQAAGWLEYLGRLAIHGNIVGIVPDISDRLEQIAQSPSDSDSSPISSKVSRGEHRLIVRAVRELHTLGAASNLARAEIPIQIGKGKDLFSSLIEGDLREASFEQFINVNSAQVDAHYRPLAVILGLIDYDLKMKNAPLTLWRPSYKLTMEQMIDVLKFARDSTCETIPQDSPFDSIPYANLIKARMLVNMGCSCDVNRLVSDPIERHLLKAGRYQRMREYCHGADAIREALSKAPLSQQAEITNLKERATRLCNWNRITRTYKAYCQHGRNDDLPISEATSGFRPTSKSCPRNFIRSMEKLFWAKVWAGDCNGAFSELNDLRELIEKERMNCHPLINSRLEYMRNVQTECSGRQVYHFTTDAAAQIFEKLKHDDIAGAQQHWYDVYRSNSDYIEAKNLLMAILIYKYPKAAYSPCLESSLLTGQQELDLPFLRLVDDVFEGRPRPPCLDSDYECHAERMKAHYVTGDMKGAEVHASRIPHDTPFALRALQMSACLNLCSKYHDPEQLCMANDQFRLILQQLGDINHEHIVMGQRLAYSICDAGNKPVADITSLKYGTILVPMEPILDRIRNLLSIIPFSPYQSRGRTINITLKGGSTLRKFNYPCQMCHSVHSRSSPCHYGVGGDAATAANFGNLKPLPKFSMLGTKDGSAGTSGIMPKFSFMDDYSVPTGFVSSPSPWNSNVQVLSSSPSLQSSQIHDIGGQQCPFASTGHKSTIRRTIMPSRDSIESSSFSVPRIDDDGSMLPQRTVRGGGSSYGRSSCGSKMGSGSGGWSSYQPTTLPFPMSHQNGFPISSLTMGMGGERGTTTGSNSASCGSRSSFNNALPMTQTMPQTIPFQYGLYGSPMGYPLGFNTSPQFNSMMGFVPRSSYPRSKSRRESSSSSSSSSSSHRKRLRRRDSEDREIEKIDTCRDKKKRKRKNKEEEELDNAADESINAIKKKGTPCSGLSTEIRKDMEPVIKKIESNCRKSVKLNAKQLIDHSRKLVNTMTKQISQDELDSVYQKPKYKWIKVPSEPETTDKPPKGAIVFGGPADPDNLNPPEKVAIPPEGAKIVGGPLGNTKELDKGEPKEVLDSGEGSAESPPSEGGGEETPSDAPEGAPEGGGEGGEGNEEGGEGGEGTLSEGAESPPPVLEQ